MCFENKTPSGCVGDSAKINHSTVAANARHDIAALNGQLAKTGV
jgi:hypothetical protein